MIWDVFLRMCAFERSRQEIGRKERDERTRIVPLV